MTARFKNNKLTLATCGLLAAAGLTIGCSSGSSGGSGGSGAAPAPPLPDEDEDGPLQAQMTAPVRDGNYDYYTESLNEIQGAGMATTLGIAPNGTDTLVAQAPENVVKRIVNGQVLHEESFLARVKSVANVGTSTMAASADPARTGTGDVFRRTQFGQIGSWSLALDTDASEAYVSAVGNKLWALVGGEDQDGLLYELDQTAASGSFTVVANIGSAIPLKAVQWEGNDYVGAMGNQLGGGRARLFRMVAGSPVEIDMPGSLGGGGVRQEITDIVEVATVNTGSIAVTHSSLLIVSVGSFDRNLSQPLNGFVAITDGVDFEVLGTWSDDAPTSLAFHDETLYVGTGNGQLLYRAADGSFVAEPGFAGFTRINDLLSRDANTLVIAGAGDRGALVSVRVGDGTGVGGGGGGGAVLDRFYTPDVVNILQAKCASCHTNAAIVGNSMLLSANLADENGDYAIVAGLVDTGAPALSQLLLKAGQTNGVTHTGGTLISAGDADHSILTQWISAGAPQAAGSGTGNRRTFVADVAPILAAGGANCNQCHNNASGRAFRISADANTTQDHQAARNFSSLLTPDSSQLLRRPSGQDAHPVQPLPVGSANYNTIVQWLNDGGLFN